MPYRVHQRYGLEDEKQGDIERFRKEIRRLTNGAEYGPEEAQFSQRVREIGSALADESVVAAGMAGPVL